MTIEGIIILTIAGIIIWAILGIPQIPQYNPKIKWYKIKVTLIGGPLVGIATLIFCKHPKK